MSDPISLAPSLSTSSFKSLAVDWSDGKPLFPEYREKVKPRALARYYRLKEQKSSAIPIS